jgi:hypothetical protein
MEIEVSEQLAMLCDTRLEGGPEVSPRQSTSFPLLR